MPRRTGDQEPEPPGGRAAERLREFIEQRYPDEPEPSGEQPENQSPDAGSDDVAGGDERT